MDTTYKLSDENIVTIYWTRSDINWYCNVTRLEITVSANNCTSCVEDVVVQVPILNMTHSFETKLTACASYQYKIFESSKSEPSFVVDFTTKEQFEKVKFNVIHDALNATRVSWTNTEHLLCPKKFRIEIFEDGQSRRQRDSTSFNETFEGLEPCVEYEIKIYPLQSNDSISRAHEAVDFTTIPSLLVSGIRNLALEQVRLGYEDSIRVTWLAPIIGSKCVLSYNMVVVSDNDLDQRSNTQIATDYLVAIIPRVASCNEYTVRVSANIFGEMSSAEVYNSTVIPARGNENVLKAHDLM